MSCKFSANGFKSAPCAPKQEDIEKAQDTNPHSQDRDSHASTAVLSIWVFINVLATVTIVHINKKILSTSSFSNCYFSFVAYHFTITSLILFIAGRPSIAIFQPVRMSLISVLPLSIITCANVILMNLALASSSILFYQVVRILLTPTTVVINLFFYNSKLPTNAILALLPACVGVVLVIYSDALSHSSKDQNQPPTMAATSDLGIIFSIAGLLCSSLYTVWIAHHVSRLQLSSVQLLFNQVPCCAALLSLLSVFTDTFPIWRDLTSQQWCLLLLSGGCACMIHLSTFIIIKAAGPVASTVVALIKTCLIVGLGWLENPGKMGWESVLGIILALSGIICYSFAMHPYGAR